MSYMGLIPTMVAYCENLAQFRREINDGETGRIQILEIGVDRGQTALPLMHNLSYNGIVFDWVGIDIRLDENFDQQLVLMEGFDPDFLEGVSSKSRTFYTIENSLKILPTMNHRFDLVLIDGDHNYDTVKEELSHLSRITHSLSLVICDDYKGRHVNKDSFYRQYQTHKDLKTASTHLQEDVNKGGVTRAVDEFAEDEKWSLWSYDKEYEPAILTRTLSLGWRPLEKIKVRGTGRSLIHPEEFVHHFNFIDYLDRVKPERQQNLRRQEAAKASLRSMSGEAGTDIQQRVQPNKKK